DFSLVRRLPPPDRARTNAAAPQHVSPPCNRVRFDPECTCERVEIEIIAFGRPVDPEFGPLLDPTLTHRNSRTTSIRPTDVPVELLKVLGRDPVLQDRLATGLLDVVLVEVGL